MVMKEQRIHKDIHGLQLEIKCVRCEEQGKCMRNGRKPRGCGGTALRTGVSEDLLCREAEDRGSLGG